MKTQAKETGPAKSRTLTEVALDALDVVVGGQYGITGYQQRPAHGVTGALRAQQGLAGSVGAGIAGGGG